MIKSLRVEGARLVDFLQYFVSQLLFEGLKEYLFSIRFLCFIYFLWDVCLVFIVYLYLL